MNDVTPIRRARKAKDEAPETKINQPDPESTKRYIFEIERKNERMLSMRGKYMSECKVVQNEKKAIYRAAKIDGHNVKALKAEVEDRILQAKRKELVNGLDLDEQAHLAMIRRHLGVLADTPLGVAALGGNGAEATI